MSARRRIGATLLAGVSALLLAACGSRPPAPEWQMNAVGALERYQQAWLVGADRAATAEFQRAREALAATGDPTLVARAELTRCAMQVAALDFGPCPGFEVLRADVPAPERAYAGYLSGVALDAASIGLLPARHRAAASSDAAGATQAVRAIDDPVARLVAAGALLRAGRGSPALAEAAVETAGTQGWRRALVAWLGVQARGAEQAGQVEEAQRLRRRIDLATGGTR